MNAQLLNRVVIGALIVVAWGYLTAGSCKDSGTIGPTPPPELNACDVIYDAGWDVNGGRLYVNKPTYCPFKLLGMMEIPYAATAELPTLRWEFGIYHAVVVDRNNAIATQVIVPTWSNGTSGGNPIYVVQISHNYWAARGGFDINNRGWDIMRNGFRDKFTRDTLYARAYLTYAYGTPSNNLVAPAAVSAYTLYTASARVDDPMFVGDVTYSWYRNDQLVGTSSIDQFTISSGAPWTFESVQVLVSDAYGHSRLGSVNVEVRGDCPPEQPNCV